MEFLIARMSIQLLYKQSMMPSRKLRRMQLQPKRQMKLES